MQVHPFHTVSCEAMHKLYPAAKLYGSSRHISKLPSLPWQPDTVDSQTVRDSFAGPFQVGSFTN